MTDRMVLRWRNSAYKMYASSDFLAVTVSSTGLERLQGKTLNNNLRSVFGYFNEDVWAYTPIYLVENQRENSIVFTYEKLLQQYLLEHHATDHQPFRLKNISI